MKTITNELKDQCVEIDDKFRCSLIYNYYYDPNGVRKKTKRLVDKKQFSNYKDAHRWALKKLSGKAQKTLKKE